jgi:hypothetical protein
MSVYLTAMGGATKSNQETTSALCCGAKGVCGFFISIFFMGRVQHVCESTLSYASVTSDMWTGLDEWRRHDETNGEDGSKLLSVVLCSFSLLQFSGALARLIVPHKHRSLNFFRAVLALTACSEAPLGALVLMESDSAMKWVSVTLSFGSVLVQVMNLFVATLLKRRAMALVAARPVKEKLPSTHLKMIAADKVKKAPPPPPPVAVDEYKPEDFMVDEEGMDSPSKKGSTGATKQCAWTKMNFEAV